MADTTTAKKSTKKSTASTALKWPVPHVRLAFVGRVLSAREAARYEVGACPIGLFQASTGLGLVTVKKMADIGREMMWGQKECGFCGEETSLADRKTAKVAKNWADVPLHSCCTDLENGLGPTNHIPGWEKDLKGLEAKFASKALKPKTPVYSDDCQDCSKRFTVTLDVVVGTVRRYGDHIRMHRCKGCAMQREEKKAAAPQATKAGRPTLPALATLEERLHAKASDVLARVAPRTEVQ